MINGGYIIQPRIIQESDISVAPPYVREIWNYLIREANYNDCKYNGYVVKRGQTFRSYEDIREGTKWFIGWRKMTYKENHTKKAMKYLRDTGRITTTKELGGVLITICKYDYYQDPKNYERTMNGTEQRTVAEPLRNQPLPINNKNEKKNKNDKKKTINTLMSELDSSDQPHEKIAYSFWSLFVENLNRLKIQSSDLEKAKYSVWVDPIRLMMERDKRTLEDIQEVFRYLRDETPRENGFSWAGNIRSTSKLREKFEYILKDARTKGGKLDKVTHLANISQSIIQKINAGILAS